MSSVLRNTLFGLGLLLVLWLGYTYVLKSEIDTPLLDPVDSARLKQAQEIYMRLNQLKSIRISDTLFSDPRFYALTDLRQNTQAEPVGRQNPFEPF